MKINPGTLYLTRAPITGVLIPITNKLIIKKKEFKNYVLHFYSKLHFKEINL